METLYFGYQEENRSEQSRLSRQVALYLRIVSAICRKKNLEYLRLGIQSPLKLWCWGKNNNNKITNKQKTDFCNIGMQLIN